MSVTPYAALTTLLLDEGWKEVSQGELGVLLGKGPARTPVPYALQADTLLWRNLLVAVAQVEHETPERLRSRITRFLSDLPMPEQAFIERASLDLHLEGPGVRGHETAAYDYGRFVASLADAVKELVKDAVGLDRHNRELQIVGGAGQGSVAVLVREPPPHAMAHQAALPGHEVPESAERRALRALTQILNTSEEGASHPTDSMLDAQLNLAPAARRSLAQLAGVMYRGGWITRGHFFSPDLEEPLPVGLSMPGALHLRRTATDAKQRTRREVVHGQLDGWLWSTATMYFIPDNRAPIRAAVPVALQDAVAQLISSQQRSARAAFEVLERQAPNGGAISRTYALFDLSPDEPLAFLDDE